EDAFVMIVTKHNSKGSGFFINENTIITNYHVVKMDQQPEFLKGRDSITRYKTSEMIWHDETKDLAMFRTAQKNSSWLDLRVQEMLPGEPIYNISNPGKRQFVFLQ